jgi:hypothetical protein
MVFCTKSPETKSVSGLLLFVVIQAEKCEKQAPLWHL